MCITGRVSVRAVLIARRWRVAWLAWLSHDRRSLSSRDHWTAEHGSIGVKVGSRLRYTRLRLHLRLHRLHLRLHRLHLRLRLWLVHLRGHLWWSLGRLHGRAWR